MFTDRIFTGLTKDGKYRILKLKYKKISSSTGYVNSTVYIDLRTKEEFNYDEIEHKTLKPISNIIGNKKIMTRKKVINCYKADANKLYSLNDIFYGDTVSCLIDSSEQKLIKPNIKEFGNLFYKIEDDRYLCLIDNKEYNTFRLLLILYTEFTLKKNLDKYYVDSVRPLETKNQELPKRKILEMSYRKELK